MDLVILPRATAFVSDLMRFSTNIGIGMYSSDCDSDVVDDGKYSGDGGNEYDVDSNGIGNVDGNENPAMFKPVTHVLLDIFDKFNELNNNGDQQQEHQCRYSPLMSVSVDNIADTRRTLRETFTQTFPEPRRSKRFIIVIDRRHRNSKNKDDYPKNVTEDQCLIYALPRSLSEIPVNHSFDNFIAVTADHLLPDIGHPPSLGPQFIGAKSDSFAETFIISFQCSTALDIRMQWFFNGGGIRFHPRYFFDVWPQCFKKLDGIDRSKYNERFIDQRWSLATEDATFQQWYNTIAPTL